MRADPLAPPTFMSVYTKVEDEPHKLFFYLSTGNSTEYLPKNIPHSASCERWGHAQVLRLHLVTIDGITNVWDVTKGTRKNAKLLFSATRKWRRCCCSAAGIRGLLRRQISEKKRVNSSSFHWHFLTWVNKYTCLEVSLKTKETLLGVYPDCPNCSLFCCVCVHFKQTWRKLWS